MNETYIQHHGDGGTTLVGQDAMDFYRAAQIKSALGLWVRAKIKVHRRVSPLMLLGMAGQITGKTYSRLEYEDAIADLDVWLKTMKTAIPHLGPKGEQL